MKFYLILVCLFLLPQLVWAQLPGECDYISSYPNNTSNWHENDFRNVLAVNEFQYPHNDTTDIKVCKSLLNYGIFFNVMNLDIVATIIDSNNVVVKTYQFDGPDTSFSFGGYFNHQWSFDSTSNFAPGTYELQAYFAEWPNEELVLNFVIEQIIPVELVNFVAKFENQAVVLEWETATELNNFGFFVEKSINGKNWQNIGLVPGNGTSTQKHYYNFIDSNPDFSYIYYRLGQIDYDGTVTYSQVIQIENILESLPTEFVLKQNYPNPFNSATNIIYIVENPGHVLLVVRNILGQEISKLVDEYKSTGIYKVIFQADKFASGLYTYTLIYKGINKISKKMTILK